MTLTAARESGTIRAPILASRRRSLVDSRSTTSQGSVWISLGRQPVSMSSRMRISAPDGVLPGRRRPYGHGSYFRRCRQAAGRSLGGGNVDNGRRTLRFWHPLPVFAQALDVVADRLGSRVRPLIVFVEVVATDGAMTACRQDALFALTDDAGFSRTQVAFLTAYQDRESAGFKKTVSGLAWGSFAWFVSEPDRIVILRDGESSPALLSTLIPQ